MGNRPKHIAMFLPALWGGGAERTMLYLCQGLAEHGYKVDLVLSQAEGPYLSEIPACVRLIELNSRHRSFLLTLSSLPALVRYLRTERPYTLITALHANIIALWARRLAGFPQKVVIVEQNTFSHQNQVLPRWYSLLMTQLVRWVYPWADEIVGVSKGVTDDLSDVLRVPRDRIKIIYNPIITPLLRAKIEAPFSHPWFLPGSPPVILGIGRLSEQKDFGTLLHAFARVRGIRPSRLLILGEGENREELESLVRKLDLVRDVSMPGFVTNPYPFLARASLFVLSSKWEGLPTVLVEAMYCGTPVIATDCPSGPREILAEGRYGQLIPVGDIPALTRSIEMILNNPSNGAPRESLQPFEIETVLEQYMSIL